MGDHPRPAVCPRCRFRYPVAIRSLFGWPITLLLLGEVFNLTYMLQHLFLILDVFWRDLAEIRRLKLLSKIEKNWNAAKNKVEDEKMLKNMVRFRN